MLLQFVMLLPLLAPEQALENGQLHLQPAKEFRVTCELSQADSEESVQVPIVTVLAGQKATIRNQTQTPFVTDLIQKNGAVQPLVEVVSEGFAIDIRVRETADGNILLQVSAQHSQIEDVKEVQLLQGTQSSDGNRPMVQCPEIREQSVRVGRSVNDGGTTVIAFPGGQQMTIKVNRVK